MRAGLQAQEERADAVVGSSVHSAVARAAEAAEAKIEQRVHEQLRWITEDLPLILHRKTADALQQAWSTLPLPAEARADGASRSTSIDLLVDMESGGAATPASALPAGGSSAPPGKAAAGSSMGRPAPQRQRPPWALTRAEAAQLEPKIAQLEPNAAQPSRPTGAGAAGRSGFEQAQFRLIRAAQRAAAAAERQPSGQLPASAPAHAELLQAALVVVAAAQAAASQSAGQAHPPPMPSLPPRLGGLTSSLPMMPLGPSSMHTPQQPHPGFPLPPQSPLSYPPAHYMHPGYAWWLHGMSPPHSALPLPPPHVDGPLHGCAASGVPLRRPDAQCAAAMDAGPGATLQYDPPPGAYVFRGGSVAPCGGVDGSLGSSQSGSSLASRLPSPSRNHEADADDSHQPSAERSREQPACQPSQPVSVAASRPQLTTSGSKPKSLFGKKGAACGAPAFGPFSRPSAASAREAVLPSVMGTSTHPMPTTAPAPAPPNPAAHQSAEVSPAVSEIQAPPAPQGTHGDVFRPRGSEPSLEGLLASYADDEAAGSHGTASPLDGAYPGDSTSRRHDAVLHDDMLVLDSPNGRESLSGEEMLLRSPDLELADRSSAVDAAELGGAGADATGWQPSPEELRAHRERALACATARSASHPAVPPQPLADSSPPRASSVFGHSGGSGSASPEASPAAEDAHAEYQLMLLDALDLRDYDVLAELLDRLEAAGIYFSKMNLAQELLASVDAVRSRDASPALPTPLSPASPPSDHGQRGHGSHRCSARGVDELQVHVVERHTEAQRSTRTPSHDALAGLRIQAQSLFEASQGSVTTDSPASPVVPSLYDQPVDPRRLGVGRLQQSQRCDPAPLTGQAAGPRARPGHGSAVSHWQAGLQDASSPDGGSGASGGSLSAAHTPEPAAWSGSRSVSNQSPNHEELQGSGHSGAGAADGELLASCPPAEPRAGRAPPETAGAPPPADVPVGETSRTPVSGSPDSSTPSLIQFKVYGAPAVSPELAAMQAQSSQSWSTRGAVPLGGARPFSSHPAAAQPHKRSIAQTIMKIGARASLGGSDSDLSVEELPETRHNGDDSDGFD